MIAVIDPGWATFWGAVVGATAAVAGGWISGRVQLRSDREARQDERDARERDMRRSDLRALQDHLDVAFAAYVQGGASYVTGIPKKPEEILERARVESRTVALMERIGDHQLTKDLVQWLVAGKELASGEDAGADMGKFIKAVHERIGVLLREV